MDAIIILLALTLALAVVRESLDELLPVSMPTALQRTIGVALASLFAWGIDYSAFASFGQDLREPWMHPVLTGVVLVATGEFVRSIVAAVAHRAGEPSVQIAPISTVKAA